VVELIYLSLNLRFNIRVVFMVNYFSVGGDVSIDSEIFLGIDFVNLKISRLSFSEIFIKI
jgi:hypothetical protein